jgi:mono/diheme cytochrome c family protein
VRRLHGVLAIVAAGALAVGLAGCVDSNPQASSTPAGASTITNRAPQTDSTGKTIEATGGAAGAASTGGGAAAAGDAAAGKGFFTNTCQGCHSNGGQEAGVGPKLAGAGLSADRIKTQIVNGGGAMPPGLATGADLANVTAYVLSIQ